MPKLTFELDDTLDTVSSPGPHYPAYPTNIPSARVPTDDFDVPAEDPPNIIYDLTGTTPHSDKFNVRDPKGSLAGLIPAILYSFCRKQQRHSNRLLERS
jgi:hypothetical protein